EPERADDATRSFHTGTLHTVDNPDTIADGARTPSLGEITFPLVLRYVHDMVTVSEEAIARSMFFLWERLQRLVEPTGALAGAPGDPERGRHPARGRRHPRGPRAGDDLREQHRAVVRCERRLSRAAEGRAGAAGAGGGAREGDALRRAGGDPGGRGPPRGRAE